MLAKRRDQLIAPLVQPIQHRLPGITVAALSPGMPLGAEGYAASLVDAQVTCAYGDYADRSSMGLGIGAGAVPLALTVRLRGRPGLAFDLGLDGRVHAERALPDTLASHAIQELAGRNADALIAEVVAGYAAQLPTWDAAALSARIAAVQFDAASPAPLFAVVTRSHAGKEPVKALGKAPRRR